MTCSARLRAALLRSLIVAVTLLTVAPAAQARTFGWKVTGKGGVVYLVGSIHVLSQDFYPLNAALERTLADSDLLVEEVDYAEMMDPTVQFASLSKGQLASGQTLEQVLTPSTLALVKKSLAELGPAGDMLMHFKPWMLAVAIEGVELMKVGFDPELGLDKHFYDEAKSDGKQIQGLETAAYQISRFDEMTMAQQDRMLAETLKEVDTEVSSVNKLGEAWKTGDAVAVEKYVLSDMKSDPAMYQRLLVERNRNWMPKIEALFTRRSPALVVVGAAHLVGPDGLIAQLRAKGYTVEQL
jgi:uncharacterized protein YbaP (TraB family)